MKLDAFRKIIREEVKKAIQEEMREVLLEAVKSASAPKSFGDTNPTLIKPYTEIKSEYKPKFSEIIAEQQYQAPKPLPSTGNPMLDILNETAQAGEWRSLNGGDSYSAANAVGWAGGAPGMIGGGSNTPVVATVDEMIKSQGPVRDINDVRIDVVPDFSKFMGALKEKGSL
jgi:hypothetical protein